MRRYGLILLLIVLSSWLVVTAVAQTQPPDEPEPIRVEPPVQLLDGGVWQQPVDLEPLPAEPFLTPDSSDTCAAATSLVIPGGAQTFVDSATSSSDDPALYCAWNKPADFQGYDTVWYQFIAPENGRVEIETRYSTYDTILAVYTGTCDNLPGSLTPLACSDDSDLFVSRVEFPVAQNTTYYIEVASYQSGGSEKQLHLSAVLDPIDSYWARQDNLLAARSRHATVVVGEMIYVLGGQQDVGGTPQLVPWLDRFDTRTGQWVRQTPIPEAGQANTDMVYIKTDNDNGRFYTPSGFDGNEEQFNGTHHIYDIDTNRWFTGTNAPWPNGIPLAWTAAVARPNLPGYYVMGGITKQPTFSNDVVTDTVFFYNVANDAWLTRPTMTAPRYAHTGAWVNGRICVVGGISSGNVLLTNGECYTPGSGSWVPTADMNYPRYNAGSAVGPDGRWYVFGGVDGNGDAVAVTEVYNPATNSWSVLSPQYNLGDGPLASWPSRAWPRGEFVGNVLWVLGGNTMPNRQILPLVDTLHFQPATRYLPTVFNTFNPAQVPDDTFANARPLQFGIPQYHNFEGLLDFYDVFTFDVTTRKIVNTRLDDVPYDSNYDLYVYNSDKQLLNAGLNPEEGHREEFSLNLLPGRYYVVVHRADSAGFPNPATYRVLVEDFGTRTFDEE